TESALITIKNVERRFKTYADMKSYVKKHCEMIKIHGKKSSRNLVIGWGSTSGAIKDAINGLNIKFLQVLYIKPLSDEIHKEIKKARKVAIVELNATGQLGRLIREKTGIKIDRRILRYDGRPFTTDELRTKIQGALK